MRNGLYNIRLEPAGGGRPLNGGVLLFHNGSILGGDAFFFYVGTYQGADGKWTGEFVTNQHTRSGEAVPVFGATQVSVSLSGNFADDCGDAVATVVQDGASKSFQLNMRMIADA